MKITWNDLIVKFGDIDPKKLIEDWKWLIGDNMKPIIISSIGDLFLTDNNGKFYWLNVGEGKIHFVAENENEFKRKMNDDKIADEWFMFNLVGEIKESGLELVEKKVYSYKKLPILGGEYNADNFELTDIEVHFSIAGQIHQQIKDLPDGTTVNIKIK